MLGHFKQIPIQAILTDGSLFYFFYFDFASRSVWRGTTSFTAGFRTNGLGYVSLPPEQDITFCGQFKIGIAQYVWPTDSAVVETILHVFINSFHLSISGLMNRQREIDPEEYAALKHAYHLSSECLMTFQKVAELAKISPDTAETYAEQAFTLLSQRYHNFCPH